MHDQPMTLADGFTRFVRRFSGQGARKANKRHVPYGVPQGRASTK